ncbi:MAG TPA: DUF5683 domain-containing protein [Bacteroidia bacterium]
MFLSTTPVYSQLIRDTVKTGDVTGTVVTNDTIKKAPGKYHSPKKAAAFSAILPGAGQIYNKKYWKVPVMYAGFAGLAYSFQFNQSRYVQYRDALKFRLDDDEATTDNYVDVYTDDQLTTLYQYYHRYRDLTVIGGAVLYLLNIVDAAVDAHLFTFNVSDDLSLNLHPALINTATIGNRYTTGMGLSIHF